MSETRLTTAQKIVKNTPMGGNVGTDKYVFIIDDVQLLVLEPVLGTNLYEKIKTDYDNDSLIGLYKTLLEDYIQPFLNKAVFADYVSNGSYRIRNNGNLKNTPNNAETMETQENVRLMRHYTNVADRFLAKMEDFLMHKGSEIPEYLTQDNNYDVEPKNNKGYKIGWFL